MKLIGVDVETYYDKEYSLRKMTVPEYVLDPRFEAIMWGVWEQGKSPTHLSHQEFSQYLDTLPHEVMMVSHNALFDMCVLRWRYGYLPRLMVDSMGLARAMFASKLRSVSLKAVADHLGLPAKGDTVHKVVGMRTADIKAAGLWDSYGAYSAHDAYLSVQIMANALLHGYPRHELKTLDMVLRCAVNPKFVLDETLLHEHLATVKSSKQALLDRCGLADRDVLMSNDRFADALRALGVEPPTKISKLTGNRTYAFAKTDQAMADLEEHENPDVQALVSARLGLKTTLEETRTQKFINIARLQWPEYMGGQALMPIPLRYSGAHTHRLSGDWQLNLQNMPRGGNLRRSLKAPKGYKVVARDASQIEARMTAWFCEQEDLRQAFENGDDIYSMFAAEEIYKRPVNKKEHPKERFVGKQVILGCGFGVGWARFLDMIHTLSRLQLGEKMDMTEAEARNIINAYRRRYANIKAMWKTLQAILFKMTVPGCDIPIGPNGIVRMQYKSILLPNGMRLYYEDLKFENNQWTFTYQGKIKYLHGGAVLENIIQGLARICTMDAALRVDDRMREALPQLRTGLAWLEMDDLELALQVHDELVYVVPEQLARFLDRVLEQEMNRKPVWGLTIPLASEGDIADSYGDAK